MAYAMALDDDKAFFDYKKI